MGVLWTVPTRDIMALIINQVHNALKHRMMHDGETGYMISLKLCDALMTFCISLPNEEDLAMLPIVDITPVDIWCPSNFDGMAQFQRFTLDPPTFAQLATRTGLEKCCSRCPY
jgi:hypothetical protein